MRFPDTWNNFSPTGGNPHLVMNVCGDGAHKVEVSGRRANGHPTLPPLISTEEGYNVASTAAGQEADWVRKRERRP